MKLTIFIIMKFIVTISAIISYHRYRFFLISKYFYYYYRLVVYIRLMVQKLWQGCYMSNNISIYKAGNNFDHICIIIKRKMAIKITGKQYLMSNTGLDVPLVLSQLNSETLVKIIISAYNMFIVNYYVRVCQNFVIFYLYSCFT